MRQRYFSIRAKSTMHEAHQISTSARDLAAESLINKYKYKASSKVEQTTRSVMAGVTEKRRIL